MELKRFLGQALIFLSGIVLSLGVPLLIVRWQQIVIGILALLLIVASSIWAGYALGSKVSKSVTLVTGETKLYKSAIDLIRQRQFGVIRIYAPVGFWQASNYKQEWFRELNLYLTRSADSEVLLVFGVPYWKSAFTYMESTLKEVFSRSDRVVIRYIPPTVRPKAEEFPTVGMIIFDSNIVTLGLGIKESFDKADTAWTIADKDIAKTANEWFVKYVWEPNHGHVLKSRDVSLEEGFANFLKKYGSKLEDKR